MNRKQRVIISNAGVLTDISSQVNDYLSGAVAPMIVAATDKIYIGTELPFNHKYIEVGTANASACVVSVESWNGNSWVPSVDVSDETAVSGKAFAQSGLLQFAPDIDRSNWGCHRDSNTIAELVGTRVFNSYWLRLSFSADLDATTTLKFIGDRFSSDNDLYTRYPNFNSASVKKAFAGSATKIDWNDQAYAAAEAIVADLRAQNIAIRREQIMDVSLFIAPSIHKVAEIIFTGLGNAYLDRAKMAASAYRDALSMGKFEIDANATGDADEIEKTHEQRYLTR